MRYLDPWNELERLKGSNGNSSGYSSISGTEFPAINAWKGEDHAVITTEVPGVDPQDIEISVAGSSLTLRGIKKSEQTEEGAYHRRERWHGSFTKVLELPFDIEQDKVEARFVKGVLYVALPRAEADKPKKISIQCN
ncbi:MAG TPA: Hsp20/alpha crystallin family protein [Dissulfurispiraceae bacterium]